MKNIKLFITLYLICICTWAYAQPANNNCSNAIDLSSSLGQGADNVINAGTYDNTDATTTSDDPTTGFECFGEPDGNGGTPSLDNTLWFKITGDGNDYYIQASSTDCTVSDGIDANDTQMATYTGTCNALMPLACNEDMENTSQSNYPAALQLSTVVGETYYILVDGFNFQSTTTNILAAGEFCMFITQLELIACNAPNVSGGTASTTTPHVCNGDANITIDGALAPNEGAVNGYAWVVSAMDLEGNPDFIINQNFIGGFPVSSEPDSPFSFTMTDSNFMPETPYYFTLVAFGNATWIDPSNQVLINHAMLDSDCMVLSNSVKINYCTDVGIVEVDETVLGMTIFPNPIKDVIHLNINSNDYMTATIMVNTITGQVVREEKITLVNGNNTFSMNMSDAATGIYIISTTSDTHQSVKRFLKR